MKRLLVVFTVLSFMMPILLTACGGDGGGKTQTTTPTAITTTIVTPTPTTSGDPVKIGVIESWSGPLAVSGLLCDQIIAVLDKQVKDRGGILGGREIKFIKGDDGGVVAQSSAQAQKLILEDKVSILTVGGNGLPSEDAVAQVAEEFKVPYVAVSMLHNIEDLKYSASLLNSEMYISRVSNFLIDVIKPKTVAWFGPDISDAHDAVHGYDNIVGAKDRLKAKGIDVISEQYYPLSTQDFSPYLTKIKYLNPDIVLCWTNDTGQTITIVKQMQELGGWGDIKFYTTEAGVSTTILKTPSMVGNYVAVEWLPGSDEPGMKTFEDSFKEVHNRVPTPELTFFYNSIGTAIKAIELAGSDDPGKIAQILRSGNLEWESAWGPMRFGTNGISQISGMIAQVQEGGNLVKVWPQ